MQRWGRVAWMAGLTLVAVCEAQEVQAERAVRGEMRGERGGPVRAGGGMTLVGVAGEWPAVSGLLLKIGEERLTVDRPELRELETAGPSPVDYEAGFEAREMWPGGKSGALSLSPGRDEEGTLVLGGLYGQLWPQSVEVSSEDGARRFVAGEDYRINEVWGQIAGIGGRLGKSGRIKVKFSVALQRLDLVQWSGGRLSVKRGASSLVCPVLPEADAGAVGVAGVYVAPWRRGGEYVVKEEDIFPIRAVSEVRPVNAEALAGTVGRLREGKRVRIAFMGDSVTLGAESPAWWDGLWTAANLAYPSRVVVGLRERFPRAEVEGMLAVRGGTTAKVAAPFFEEKVAGSGANLLVIAFGLNDADGPVGEGPRNSVEDYQQGIRSVIRKARGLGMEVMLVTPMQPSPFLRNGIAGRILKYRQALLELAREEQVACADVYSAWMQQADGGTPPFSQLHNWINHPGKRGHALYARVVMACFGQVLEPW